MGKLVAIGGGQIPRWSFETKDDRQNKYETKQIDEEIVRLSCKKNPKLLFIGTASRENSFYFNAIKDIYGKLNCNVSELCILNDILSKKRIKEKIINSDIIYIGGGNTKFMLQTWKKYNIDTYLKDAYNKGIVIAGFSAGSYCMFKYNYELIEGLNFINAINCVHYNEKSKDKKEQFKKVIKDKKLVGIAMENGTAIEILDDKYKIIKDIQTVKVFKLFEDNKVELDNINEYNKLDKLLNYEE